jgi:hypothetical protein
VLEREREREREKERKRERERERWSESQNYICCSHVLSTNFLRHAHVLSEQK